MDFKKKTLFIIAGTAIAIIMLIWNVAIPLVNEANTLGTNINDYQGEISKFAGYTNYVSALNDSYKKNEDAMARAGAAIVRNTESGKLDFLRELEAISDKTSNELDTALANDANAKKSSKSSSGDKDAQTPASSSYSSFALNLEVKGTFSTLLNMLVKAENMQYYTNIDSISISSLADNKSPGQTTKSNIKLKVFIKP